VNHLGIDELAELEARMPCLLGLFFADILESSFSVGQNRPGSLGWVVVKRELRDQATLMLNPHRRVR
jgi:hypothetical protein